MSRALRHGFWRAAVSGLARAERVFPETRCEAEKFQDASSAFRFGLAREFFQGFANEARCNLHLELLYGDEPHHIVEALFKAFARAVDAARRRDPRIAGQLPSTKGKL